MSSFLPLATLPLRPSTQTLLQQRGFITLGEWNEAKRAGLESLAAELQLDPSDAQGIWKEIQECVCAAGPESQQAPQAPRTTKAMTASELLATSSSSSSSSSLSPPSPSPLGIVSFCRAIDQLFWTGGIPLGSLTEVAGLPGAGKTQLAMQLAVTARLPQFLGGVQGQTIYIDTEGSLVPERIYDMAQALLIHIQGTLNKRRHAHARPSSSSTTTIPTPTTLPKDFDSPEAILEKIHVFRVYDSAALLSTLYSLPHWIETLGTSNTTGATGTSRQDDPSHQQSSSLPIKLIIVDSIAFPFRSSSTPWQSAQSLTQLAGFLNDLASQYQLAVVCINHMTTTKRKGNKASLQQGSNHPSTTTTTNEDGGGESSISYIPALGDSWAHAVTTRLILEPPLSVGPPNQQHQQQRRCCRLVKSPCMPSGVALFQITEQGIRDVVVGDRTSTTNVGSTTSTTTATPSLTRVMKNNHHHHHDKTNTNITNVKTNASNNKENQAHSHPQVIKRLRTDYR